MRGEKELAPQIRKLHSNTAARIIFDSSVSPLPSGFRGIVQDRHLLFIDQDFDIHMKIAAAGRHQEIHGQVIPRAPTEESCLVMLLIQEELKETTKTDRFGEFSFQEVPAGDVAVEILVPSRRLPRS